LLKIYSFLKGSGTILLIDQDLWSVVNNWVEGLDVEVFTQVLPLLRRTFAHFSGPERRKIGERAKSGKVNRGMEQGSVELLDHQRAIKGLPVVLQILGYSNIQLDAYEQ
jgi:hypothetical protein